MQPDLTDEETASLIEYARRKFAEERYPLAPDLSPIREALAKLDPKPNPPPPAKPFVSNSAMRKKRR